MCLLLIAIDVLPRYPLLMLGNRDEFHARASAAAQPWTENSQIAGGRDLVADGSWLALRNNGRFAAVTNVRTGVPSTAPRSRGWLVRDFVFGDAAPGVFLDDLRAAVDDYGPFNLVVGDHDGVFALGSSDRITHRFAAGVHVVSNGPIGVQWPKTERLQRRFCHLVAEMDGQVDETRLLDLLFDETQPPDDALPNTGIGHVLERVLAPVFIRGDQYGTRASTLVMRGADGRCVLRERRFGAAAAFVGDERWSANPGRDFQNSLL